MEQKLKIPCILVAGLLSFAGCGDNNKTKTAVHDPTAPVTLASFRPDSGHIKEQVLLDGSNFGSDLSQIKVFFNNKEAAVVGSSGSRILALVPRMPGDTCEVAVEVAGQRYVYPKPFFYKMGATVTTLMGDGTAAFDINQPILTSMKIRPVYMAIDDDDNLFVTEDIRRTLVKINLKTEQVTVASDMVYGVPTYNKGTGWLQTHSDGNPTGIITYDPRDGYLARVHSITKWLPPRKAFPAVPSSTTWEGQTTSVLYCKADGFSYLRVNGGHVYRVNTKTWEAEVIGMTPDGQAPGMSFNTKKPTELWFGCVAGTLANRLCKIDVASADSTLDFQIMSGPVGFRDGALDQAMFNSFRQITFDEDGNLWVGDCGNGCIRLVRTTVTPMTVETVVGIPTVKSPFRDGTKEEAIFGEPHGLVMDSEGTSYVTDWQYCRIRRIAIE